MSEPPTALAESARKRCLTIAIDGPAGAGKSTVGTALARALGCCCLDTGLMYRAVTAAAMERGVSLTDGAALGTLAGSMRFRIDADTPTHLIVNDLPAGEELRTADVDATVSTVSAHAEVRAAMVERQRALATGRCFVMIGRDIGTTVLPDADVKIWVTASAEERARRRLGEHLVGSNGLTVQQVADQIRSRDHVDSTRAVSPLTRSPEAVVLDTEGLAPSAALQHSLRIVEDALRRLAPARPPCE